MSAKLEIVWDGTVQGLSEHRLSLEAFGPALDRLLIAIRRIASEQEMKARGPDRQRTHGRLAREAANLDVQLVTIRANSPVTIEAMIVPVDAPSMPLITDLPDSAVDEFLIDIEREAHGAPTHYHVRSFLKALPKGLEHQKYVHRSEDGQVRREVIVDSMKIAAAATVPHLVELWGLLVGFGFEAARPEIKVRAHSGDLVTFSATPSQVEESLSMRLSEVYVIAVSEQPARPARLLSVSASEPDILGDADRTAYLFDRWNGLLSRLAQ